MAKYNKEKNLVSTEFLADEKKRAEGLNGPGEILSTLIEISKMFNPDAIHNDGETQGGISAENLRKNIISEEYISEEFLDEFSGNIFNKITDPDGYPIHDNNTQITYKFQQGRTGTSDGTFDEERTDYWCVYKIPVNNKFSFTTSNGALTQLICYDENGELIKGWNVEDDVFYNYQWKESPNTLTTLPSETAYISFNIKVVNDGEEAPTLILSDSLKTNNIEFKKIYFSDHGYSIYGKEIDNDTMHKLVIDAEGEDDNEYNIVEIRAPKNNPRESTLCLKNSGNNITQFVDFSSMVYNSESPTVEIVCQTRGGRKLPEFSVRFNDGQGAGRVKKFVVTPDCIPLMLTKDGVVVRKNNNFDNKATDDELVTINLFELYESNSSNSKARHTHDNAEALSSITQEMIDKWNSADYGKANSLYYFFANNLNNSLYGQIDTSGALVADYIFKNNSMTDITVDLSSCVSLIGGFLNSEVENLTFENGTPKLTKANSLLNGCKKLKSVRGLDLSNTTDIKYLCKDCESLTDEMNIDSPATDISYILYNCKAITKATINAENVTNATGAFTGCYSLTNLILPGMTVSFDISDTAIEDFTELFTSLGTASSGATITIGDKEISEETKAIATGKGWTIV